MTQEQSGPPTVAQVFEMLAGVYDQSGVDFFQPVGARLVALLDPQPGERCLDIGCGRGAATLPLARAVTPAGQVDACDVAPAMVTATDAAAEAAGLDNVTARVADAAVLDTFPDAAYDVVSSSLVLFFLPEPAAVLRRWAGKLTPGGRIGLTTFDVLDEPTQQIDALFDPWLPAGLRDARTSGQSGPFATDAGMEDLFRGAGLVDVRTIGEPTVLEFPDAATWQRFSMSTGQRAMWQAVPEEERPGLLERAAAILERTRLDDGPARLVWRMRYTLGRAGDASAAP